MFLKFEKVYILTAFYLAIRRRVSQTTSFQMKYIFDYFASFIQAMDFYVKEMRSHISLLISSPEPKAHR